MEYVLGIITGFLFGFILQRAQVLRFEKQVGFLRLQDMTIIKFMLSAILVGMVGVYGLKDLGMVSLSLKATHLGAQIVGGLLFGVGWAVLGYCPGTAVGAVGEGRWHAVWGILGMLVGAALFAELYPFLKGTIMTWGSLGKLTIPELLRIHHWIVVCIFVGMGVFLFLWFSRKRL